jgi:hypothetical protein
VSGHTALIIITALLTGSLILDAVRLDRRLRKAKDNIERVSQMAGSALFFGITIWALIVLWVAR